MGPIYIRNIFICASILYASYRVGLFIGKRFSTKKNNDQSTQSDQSYGDYTGVMNSHTPLSTGSVANPIYPQNVIVEIEDELDSPV